MVSLSAIQPIASATVMSASLPVVISTEAPSPRSRASAPRCAPKAPDWLAMPMLPGRGCPVSSDEEKVPK